MSYPTTVYITEEHIMATTSTQRYPLGTRGQTQDGRVFRYAQAGETLVAHELVMTAAELACATATDQVMVDVYAAGTTRVQIGLSTVASYATKDYYKDGYLICNSTDIAYNQQVPVFGHPALASGSATSPAANAQWIDLERPGLKKLADTDTTLWKLVANPYKSVITQEAILSNSTDVGVNAVKNGFALGVAPCAVTSTYYFWLQTWGPCLMLDSEGAGVAIDKAPGLPMFVSSGVAGAVGAGHGSSELGTASGGIAESRKVGKIGDLMTCAPADTFFCMVNLKLSP